MKAVYSDSAAVETEAKARFHFPECVMMENAAAALQKAVGFALKTQNRAARKSVLILCGGGNNGADGLALARRLCGKTECKVVLLKEPKTQEAQIQLKMAKAVGVLFENLENLDFSAQTPPAVVVDCIYGTGFHGKLSEAEIELIRKANALPSFRIACDIPSGIDKCGKIETFFDGTPLAFKADRTVTMGCLKTALFTDSAKNFTGKIKLVHLGVSSSKFGTCGKTDAFLLEKKDLILPIRKKADTHKGDFGHAAIILGEKAGAGIIAGTAALRFGAGLVTCVENENISDRFKMNPELMIAPLLPEKTDSLLIGSGLGRNPEKTGELIEKTLFPYAETKNPSLVLDADIFYAPQFPSLLKKLDSNPNSRTIITPHPKEFFTILDSVNLLSSEGANIGFSDVVKNRFEYARLFGENFKNVVLVSKGAVNYIVHGKEIYIVANGAPSLAKAGSGDVLAGLCLSLLAQGKSATEAAKTAVLAHATASSKIKNNFSLSPLGLIEFISQL